MRRFIGVNVYNFPPTTLMCFCLQNQGVIFLLIFHKGMCSKEGIAVALMSTIWNCEKHVSKPDATAENRYVYYIGHILFVTILDSAIANASLPL